MSFDTVALFGAPTSGERARWSPSPRALSSLLGMLAIPLWATWPALSLQMRELPALECVSLGFVVGWAVLWRMEPREKVSAPRAWISWVPAVAFALGESGSAAFFFMATQRISAAEANLIMYLWPGEIVALGAVLGLFRLRVRHIAGLLLAFAGAGTLLKAGSMSFSYEGIGFAFVAGISWALYCIFRLKWRGPAPTFLARGFGLSALLCGLLHFLVEPSVLPNARNLLAAAGVGILPTALAAFSWDVGIRKGDSQLLAVMAYATPLCSTLLLIGLGLESFSASLFVGAVLIVAGGLFSQTSA